MNKKKQSTTRNYSIAALIFALLACIATFFLAIMRGLSICKCSSLDIETGAPDQRRPGDLACCLCNHRIWSAASSQPGYKQC
jgi:hypothetical protein